LGVDVHYRHAVSSIETGDRGLARIHFQNGLQWQPDMVIGADGRMNSPARQFVHGHNTPIYQGFINWIGVYESDRPIVDEIVVQDTWGRGERFGVVPVTRNKVYWAGGIAQEAIDSARDVSNKDALLSIFQSWPESIPTIIESTPESSINKIFVHDHEPIAIWHRDNVVLLGDSAHAPLPTSGQGACQAMEDAWHLARCLQDHPDSLQEVFQSYTALRLKKTSAITYAARNFAAALFNRNAEDCRLRNERSKSTDYSAAVTGMASAWSQGLPMGA
jgi:FAD-dependent urate hydroxylase